MRQRIFVKMIEPEFYRKYESSEWDSLCTKSQIQTAHFKVGIRQRIFVKIIEPEFYRKYDSSDWDSLCAKSQIQTAHFYFFQNIVVQVEPAQPEFCGKKKVRWRWAFVKNVKSQIETTSCCCLGVGLLNSVLEQYFWH